MNQGKTRQGKTLFAQLMEFVPRSSFSRIVARYGGDAGVQPELYRAIPRHCLRPIDLPRVTRLILETKILYQRVLGQILFIVHFVPRLADADRMHLHSGCDQPLQ